MSEIISLAQRRAITREEVIEAFVSLHAPRTQMFYTNAIRVFEEITGCGIYDADSATAMRWAQLYQQRPGYASRFEPGKQQRVSRSTVAYQCSCLYQIWEQLKRHGFAAVNVFDGVHDLLKGAEAGDKRPTQAMSPEQVRTLLRANPGVSKVQIQEGAFLGLLFGGALRIREALGLSLGNVEQQCDLLTLTLAHTKAQKLQRQVLPGWAGALVLKLVAQRMRDGAGAADPLLTHYKRRHTIADNKFVNYTTARFWWDSMLRDAGISGHYSPHSARATAITQLSRQGVSLTELKAFSRHADIETTLIYVKRDESPEAAPGRKLEY